MTATRILMVALLAGVVGRWAANQKAVPDGKTVIEAAFVLVVVSAMDQGRTEPIARGFSWLVLGAVLLGNHSPLTALLRVTGGSAPQTAGAPMGGSSPPQTAGSPAGGSPATIPNVR